MIHSVHVMSYQQKRLTRYASLLNIKGVMALPALVQLLAVEVHDGGRRPK